jgi:hypothetical protein
MMSNDMGEKLFYVIAQAFGTLQNTKGAFAPTPPLRWGKKKNSSQD